jgi:GYF domain 2
VGLGEVVIWHVIIDGEQRGPLSRAQVLEHLHDGQLVGSDLIWRPGFSDWKPVSELADFWQPPRRGPSLPPPLPAPTELSGRNDDHSDDAPATPLIALPNKKWSIWKAASAGLTLSLFTLAIQVASGRGFEIANLVQTASVATVVQLAAQILAAPLLFVIIAVVRNIFRWRLPRSDTRAIASATVFFLMLAGTGVALALYGQWFFNSTERISGATRDYVMSTMQPACVQRQMSLRQGIKPSDEQISKYCQCFSIQMADNTTYKGLTRDSNAPDVQAYLKQQAEAAGQTCRTWMSL